MKNLKLIGLGVFMTGSLTFGQNANPPQIVNDAFTQKFPMVKSVKWNKENNTEWEAEFKMKGMEYSANFSEDGTWKETEHVVKMKDIPSSIKKTLATEFSGYKIGESEISETNDGSVYEFEIEKGEQNMEVAIDKNAKILRKEMGDEDNEDKN